MAARAKINTLPDAVRRWLEQALIGNNFSGYQELETLLREKGYVISKSAIHRYGQQMERRMAAIRASTEAARQLVAAAPDDQDSRSEAVIAMVQQELFDAIFHLKVAEEEEDTRERINILSSAAKNIATLARASVNQKEFRYRIQQRVDAAAASVEKIARKGGLSSESVAALRREILGIAA